MVRRSKRRQPAAYLEVEDPLDGERQLSRADLIVEFMMNALRLVDGFPKALFQARTGLALAETESAVVEAASRHLVECSPARIRPSPSGLRFLNELVGLFLAEDSGSSGGESRES